MPIIDLSKDLVPEGCFLNQIPKAPTGHYAHLIVVRETESFPVFQTDGTLNIAKVSAGLHSDNSLIRLAMFKRKQSSPERLTGRELLHRVNIHRMKIAAEMTTVITMKRSAVAVPTVFTTVSLSGTQAPKNQRCMLIPLTQLRGMTNPINSFHLMPSMKKGT